MNHFMTNEESEKQSNILISSIVKDVFEYNIDPVTLEGIIGNAVQGIGRIAAQGWNNLKQGWQQGMQNAQDQQQQQYGQQPQQQQPQQNIGQLKGQIFNIIKQVSAMQGGPQALQQIKQGIDTHISRQAKMAPVTQTAPNPAAPTAAPAAPPPGMIAQWNEIPGEVMAEHQRRLAGLINDKQFVNSSVFNKR